jgi:starch synthase
MALFSSKKGLKILFVATEAEPFVKVGGLGSVMYSLPKALSKQGHDARVMVPRYLSIDASVFNLQLEYSNLAVPTGDKEYGVPQTMMCNVKRFDQQTEKDPVTTYFLENQEYYEKRANVYGYADDAVRWALLCRGVLEFLKNSSEWTPDIIVCSDWQTALIPNLLKTEYKENPKLSKIATVFSIHNLYFQAMFDHRFVSEMDKDDGHSPVPSFNDPRLQKTNCMKRGIMFADAINTVSPTYAREIMTADYGELLDELLRERKAVVSGILNGIDYTAWNPEIDPLITHRYGVKNVEVREKNKAVLQDRFGLKVDKDAFLVSIVSRMSKQKGFDLLFPILPTLLGELPIQLVVVGEGETEIMGFFHELETKFPGRVATHLKFDKVLPHLVFAGADVVLVPSRFEPCGLTQIEAMRMGVIPIVRKTGGLADSVEDYSPEHGRGTGFVFDKFDSSSLMIAIIRAFENFRDKSKWKMLEQRAMSEDLSWESSAKKYTELFSRVIESRNHVS